MLALEGAGKWGVGGRRTADAGAVVDARLCLVAVEVLLGLLGEDGGVGVAVVHCVLVCLVVLRRLYLRKQEFLKRRESSLWCEYEELNRERFVEIGF